MAPARGITRAVRVVIGARLLAALALLLPSCVPTPPQPPTPPTWGITVRVIDAQSQTLLGGAAVTIGGRDYVTDALGGVAVSGLRTTPTPACAVTAGYAATCVDAVRGAIEAHVLLTPLPPPRPRDATRAELLAVRGNFCNLPGAPYFTVNYTPALAGAPADAFAAWMQAQVDAGSTHVFVGPFDPGVIYPTLPWASPDLKADGDALFAFLQAIRGYQTVRGHAMIPVLFLHGGGPTPAPYIQQWWPRIAAAIAPIADQVIVVPAWEPEAWSAAEISLGLREQARLFPTAVRAVHYWPTRWVGCSNPPQRDDPWLGPDGTCDELSFYRQAGGETVDLVFYQAPHGIPHWGDCNEDTDDNCWLNRWQDGVERLGAGGRGWPKLAGVVAYEVTAYESFRGHVTAAQARQAASLAKRICDKWGVACGYGNGLPLGMGPAAAPVTPPTTPAVRPTLPWGRRPAA